MSRVEKAVVLQRPWRQFVNQVRHYFESQDFLEVSTPTLVTCPGTEPHIDYFSTEWKVGSKTQKFFLPTSPEIHLKKILCFGEKRIFEIAKSYRNGEISEIHQPEFWMIEWYRVGQELTVLMDDCVQLIEIASGSKQRIQKLSVAEAFAQFGCELKPDCNLQQMRSFCSQLGLNFSQDDSLNDLFARICVDKIEAQLDSDTVTILHSYPPFQSANAKISRQGWADRFEIYWRGMELANAFYEVTDAEVQRQRWQAELSERAKLQREIPLLDEELLDLMKTQLPACSGIALGLERLFLAAHRLKSLDQIRLFPKSSDCFQS